MKYIRLAFIYCIIIVGCNNQKNNLNNVTTVLTTGAKTSILGSWRLSDITESGIVKNQDPLLASAKYKKTVQEGLIFSFYPNGMYTSVTGTGKYEYGKWNFVNNKKAVYIVSNTTKDTLSLKLDNENERSLLYVTPKSKNVKQTFSRQNDLEVQSDFELDPYYPDNNVWRIKPIRAENPQQIQDRLGNYMKHLAYILKQASDQKLRSVSFEFSQGIVKIYNGGIGIHPISIVPITWINTYYSKEQALLSYKMFESYLRSSNSYKGASTGEWYKDDYNILTSIYGDLKEGKFPLTVEN